LPETSGGAKWWLPLAWFLETLQTPMIYTDVLNRGAGGVRSPLDP
jgi:hypothetical protein